MTEADSKPSITFLVSLGLLSRENNEVFEQIRSELEEAGYPTQIKTQPPSGQFSSVQASLEQIIIAVGLVAVGGVGTAVATGANAFTKTFGERAGNAAFDALMAKWSKLRERSKYGEPPTEPGTAKAITTVEVDGQQTRNVLKKGAEEPKEFPTRPDRPHGHVMETDENGNVIMKRADGSGAQRWIPSELRWEPPR